MLVGDEACAAAEICVADAVPRREILKWHDLADKSWAMEFGAASRS